MPGSTSRKDTNVDATFILGCLILGALIAITLLLGRQNAQNVNPLDASIAKALEQIENGARAHAQVTTVVSLVETLQDRPELLEAIAPYTREVQAAALVNQVNNLAAALEDAEAKLLTARKNYAFYSGRDRLSMSYHAEVETLEAHCADLRGKLEVATTAAQAVNRPHVVR